MKPIAFIFTQPPHSSASGREGLDALLATSAYSEDIYCFFIGAGVTQLLEHQIPELLDLKDYIPAFKLLELYDIEQVYVSESSLQRWGVDEKQLLIDVQIIDDVSLKEKLSLCGNVIRF